MIDTTIETEIFNCLNKLSVEHQRKVLEFARTLVTTSPTGSPGSSYLRFAGIMTASEIEKMSQAIQDGCEKVDADGW